MIRWALSRRLAVGVFLAAGGLAPVAAASGDGARLSFSHKDWALQCDNTRTCRAVGYQPEGGESDPVSILLTRKAGANTPVNVQLQVYTEKASPPSLQLKVGTLLVANLAGDNPQVPDAQVPRLLHELARAESATVTAGKDRWQLSLAGASAVLLKMDEVQGRVGTPGALVRRGSRPESSVLPPLAAPVVKAVKPMSTRKGDAALLKPLLAAIDRTSVEGQCNGDPFDATHVKLHRLTDRMLLLEVPCGMGAYNFGSLLFLAHDRPPYQPTVVEDVDGEFDPATGGVHSAMKGRGIGDCWWVREWQFDGKGFTLTQERGDALCRGFPGGAWQLPAYLTQ